MLILVQRVIDDIKKKSGDLERVKDVSHELQNVLTVS